MLPKLTIFYLALSVNLMWYGGAIPFCFVGSANKGPYVVKVFDYSNKIFWKVFHWARYMINFGYVGFVAYRLSSFKSPGGDTKADLGVLVQLVYVLTCYTVSCVLDIETMLRGSTTIPYLISEYARFFRQIEGKYILHSRPQSVSTVSRKVRWTQSSKLVKCNVFLTILFVVGNIIYLQNVILMLKKPHSLHFFTSILDNPKQAKFVLRLPFILMQIWVYYNMWSNIYFYIFTVYIYSCGGVYLLRELK